MLKDMLNKERKKGLEESRIGMLYRELTKFEEAMDTQLKKLDKECMEGLLVIEEVLKKAYRRIE